MDLARNSLTLLLWATLIASGNADAQARGPAATEIRDEVPDDDPELHSARVAELDAWLRRFAGKYRVTSAVNAGRADMEEELVDCVIIGMGPGVQCMWGNGQGLDREDTPGGSALMFGMDPLALRINFLMVTGKGIAAGGLGRLSGNTLYLRMECKLPDNANSQIVACENKLRFVATSASKDLQVSKETIQRLAPPPGTRVTGSIETPAMVITSWLKRVSDFDSGSARPEDSSRP